MKSQYLRTGLHHRGCPFRLFRCCCCCRSAPLTLFLPPATNLDAGGALSLVAPSFLPRLELRYKQTKNVLRPQVLHQQNGVPRTNTVCRHHHHHHMQLSPTCNQAHSSSVDRLKCCSRPSGPAVPTENRPTTRRLTTMTYHKRAEYAVLHGQLCYASWPLADCDPEDKATTKQEARRCTRQDTIHARVSPRHARVQLLNPGKRIGVKNGQIQDVGRRHLLRSGTHLFVV